MKTGFISLKMVCVLLLAWLSAAAHAADTEFLDPEQAFALRAKALAADQVEVRFEIAEGYYLYQDKLKFAANNGVGVGAPQLPPAEIKDDPFQHKQKEVYRHALVFVLPIENAKGAFELTVTAQGCADAGLCYPPFRQKAALDVTGLTAAAKPPAATATASDAAAPPQDESSRVQSMLANQNTALTLLTFFGFGLLLALTPCVFPMIPILSSIIIGHGTEISKQRAFSLSVTYVLGMAATYALAGVAAGMTGTLLSNALQNVWVLSAFAALFVLLSLSMFDVYQLQLPSGVQSRLSDTANNQGGSLYGVALMGSLSALIVGPCVAAPLAGALLFIAQTGNAVLGGFALFSMALGMGVPLVVVGVAARSLLPRAGNWMNNVKKLFGVILLGVAIWLIAPVAPPLVVMLSIAALALFCGIFLHGLDPLPAHASSNQRLGKVLGVAAVTLGLAMLVGVLAGARDPARPLAFLQASASQTNAAAVAAAAPAFKRVRDSAELDAVLQTSPQPVMLDFYADWCVSCKEMEHLTFSDPAVQQQLRKLTLVQADVTENTEADKVLLKRFGLFGPPAVIVLDAKGKEVTRVIGFQDAERFHQTLSAAIEQINNRDGVSPRVAANKE